MAYLTALVLPIMCKRFGGSPQRVKRARVKRARVKRPI